MEREKVRLTALLFSQIQQINSYIGFCVLLLIVSGCKNKELNIRNSFGLRDSIRVEIYLGDNLEFNGYVKKAVLEHEYLSIEINDFKGEVVTVQLPEYGVKAKTLSSQNAKKVYVVIESKVDTVKLKTQLKVGLDSIRERRALFSFPAVSIKFD